MFPCSEEIVLLELLLAKNRKIKSDGEIVSHEVGEVFSSYRSAPRLVYRKYKAFLNVGKKKRKRKRATDMTKYFTKETIHTANTYLRRCSSSLVVKQYNMRPSGDATTHSLEQLK